MECHETTFISQHLAVVLRCPPVTGIDSPQCQRWAYSYAVMTTACAVNYHHFAEAHGAVLDGAVLDVMKIK